MLSESFQYVFFSTLSLSCQYSEYQNHQHNYNIQTLKQLKTDHFYLHAHPIIVQNLKIAYIQKNEKYIK